MRFAAVPDFENPLDSDADNHYEVLVMADDGAGRQTEQLITVTVTDIDEKSSSVSIVNVEPRG